MSILIFYIFQIFYFFNTIQSFYVVPYFFNKALILLIFLYLSFGPFSFELLLFASNPSSFLLLFGSFFRNFFFLLQISPFPLHFLDFFPRTFSFCSKSLLFPSSFWIFSTKLPSIAPNSSSFSHLFGPFLQIFSLKFRISLLSHSFLELFSGISSYYSKSLLFFSTFWSFLHNFSIKNPTSFSKCNFIKFLYVFCLCRPACGKAHNGMIFIIFFPETKLHLLFQCCFCIIFQKCKHLIRRRVKT